MEKKVEEQLLFDFYGDLLTENQREILHSYYEDDLGLAEIASVLGYREQSSLNRSCSRWFGQSPKALRKGESRQT